jgi:hypothetical protein
MSSAIIMADIHEMASEKWRNVKKWHRRVMKKRIRK